MNEAIAKFITEFESKFGSYLDPQIKYRGQESRTSPLYTSYFTIFKGEKEYSDWDLHCCANTRLDIKALSSIEKFVRAFPNFSCVGLVLTTLTAHSGYEFSYHYVNTSNVLHLMGFINKAKTAPFFDFHAENIPNHLLRSLHGNTSSQEFIDWIMLTYWRKWQNNRDHPDLPGLLSVILLCFKKSEQVPIENNPVGFFQKHLRGRYSEAVDFLK